MPVHYENLELLYSDDFESREHWHHEGIGELAAAPEGGMRLHCHGSRQGGRGCMAFFRPTLPDQVAYEYDITVRSHGGLVINYLAIRGLNDEDMIEDAHMLRPREGIMANYYALKWGLQSYHVSFSRFGDDGKHTGTSNWRKNPGAALIGHGNDLVTEVNRTFHMRVSKDWGHCQCYVDGRYAHGFIDRDNVTEKIPDTGKFGFRLIGSDVMADIHHFRVCRIEHNEGVWKVRD